MSIRRHDEHEAKERQQRDALVAEFDTGNSEATLQAMAAAVLNYRQVVNQLLRAINLAPGKYYFTETSPARYSDKVGFVDFSDEKVIWLERASRQSSVDCPTTSQ